MYTDFLCLSAPCLLIVWMNLEIQNSERTKSEGKLIYRKSLPAKTVRNISIVTNIIFVYWCYVTFNVSRNYDDSKYHKLSAGWMFGLLVDNSDAQYAGFRNNALILALVFTTQQSVFKMIGLLRLVLRPKLYFKIKKSITLTFSIGFLCALFGISVVKIIGIISVHYLLINKTKGKTSIALSWTFSLLILYLNTKYNGYEFGKISSYLGWLDSFRGVGLRWHITFNFNMLRMVSFTMDKYWAHTKMNFVDQFQTLPDLDKRQRLETSHNLDDYNYFNYLVYVLYAPLYLAGPIISFNDFMHQMIKKPASITTKSTFLYALRWLFAALIMEVMMHVFYVVAIKDTKAWKGFSPIEIFTLGYFNLKFIWLKVHMN